MAHNVREGLKSNNGSVPQYKGQLVAGLDSGYGDIYREFFGGGQGNPLLQPGDASIQKALQQQLSGQPAYKLDPKITQDWFQSSVLSPMLNTYNTRVKPQIDQAFAGSGRIFSAARGNAQARSLSDLSVGAQAQLGQAQLSNQQLSAQLAQNASNNQLSAIGAAQTFGNQQYARAGVLQSLLQPFQQNQQAQLDAQYQQFLRAQPYNNPWYQLGNQVVGQSNIALTPGAPSAGAAAGAGALSGAVGGFAVGGPWGALLGAGVGAAGGYLKSQ